MVQNSSTLILLATIILSGITLSGLYPAIVLSRFRPAKVLKGNFVRSSHGNLLRKGLVVFQFAASAVLIIGTLTIYSQLQYMQNKDLGMDIEQTLVVEGPFMTPWDSTFIERANNEIKSQSKSLNFLKSRYQY